MSADDSRWMHRAIALSHEALYITTPNPRVACLIVRNGQLLAQGTTQKAGGPHAEIMALRQAAERGIDVEGATFYVTLEPCSHHGRTPPCVDALIAAKPARVVIAMQDPNPLVGGRGIAKLRAAGIQTVESVHAAQALEVNPGFVSRMTRGTPWVWVKQGTSLDGRTALHNGLSQWITGPQARSDGHHWRARSCVVLTGFGTVRADNPLLNVRDVQTPRQPIRALVDSQFSVDEDARFFNGDPVWLFTCAKNDEKASRLADRNVQVIELDERDGRVDLNAMFQWMGAHEINEVHVEAGAILNGALLSARCVDELLVYMAPLIMGDAAGMFSLPPFQTLQQARRFEFIEASPLGTDLRIRARDMAAWQGLLRSVSRAG